VDIDEGFPLNLCTAHTGIAREYPLSCLCNIDWGMGH